MNILEYKTVAGIVLKDADMGSGGVRLCVQYTNEKEIEAYCARLEQEGFTLYIEEEIPGEPERGAATRFFVFTREDMHIFLSWIPALRVLQIRGAQPGALPNKESAPLPQNPVSPSVTQLALDKSGINHIVQLSDGSFVIMDGGIYTEEDAERFYRFLTDHTPQGKPRIALWMFSHPDIDHVQLPVEFIRTYHEDVEIEGYAYRFPDLAKEELLHGSKEELQKNTDNLRSAFDTYFPDASFYVLHTGQKFRFPGATVEILFTPDLFYPSRYVTSNDFSSAWRFCFDSGKTYLFMGDCQLDACTRMALTYGKTIKSDIFQVTHHGLIGGELGFYKLVDPDICLWSTSKPRFEGILEGQIFQWCIGEGGCDYNAWIRDDSIRKREHYPQHETVTFQV